MQATEIRNFEFSSFIDKSPRQSNILPLPESQSINHLASLEKTLSAIFPQPQEENKVQKARRILGETAINLTDEQLETNLSEFEYLINDWLDEFEKYVFEGKTLKEIIKLT